MMGETKQFPKRDLQGNQVLARISPGGDKGFFCLSCPHLPLQTHTFCPGQKSFLLSSQIQLYPYLAR
jgi:hypothetical protein